MSFFNGELIELIVKISPFLLKSNSYALFTIIKKAMRFCDDRLFSDYFSFF